MNSAVTPLILSLIVGTREIGDKHLWQVNFNLQKKPQIFINLYQPSFQKVITDEEPNTSLKSIVSAWKMSHCQSEFGRFCC